MNRKRAIFPPAFSLLLSILIHCPLSFFVAFCGTHCLPLQNDISCLWVYRLEYFWQTPMKIQNSTVQFKSEPVFYLSDRLLNKKVCPSQKLLKDQHSFYLCTKERKSQLTCYKHSHLKFKYILKKGQETSSNLHQKLYYHVLGTDQSEDILCAEFPDEPKWMGGAEVLYYYEIVPTKPMSRGLCI